MGIPAKLTMSLYSYTSYLHRITFRNSQKMDQPPDRYILDNTSRSIRYRALALPDTKTSLSPTLCPDWAVLGIARQIRRSPSIALLLVSSSYVTLAYHTHPFSNTVETTVLALCALLLGRIIQEQESPEETRTSIGARPSKPDTTHPTGAPELRTTSPILSFGLGILFSIGIFTRITFILYGFPLGIMFLGLNMKASFNGCKSLLAGVRQFVISCIPLAIGLGGTAILSILVDSFYFGKLVIINKISGQALTSRELLSTSPLEWTNLSYKGSLVMTMLNNIKYNLKEENLAQHGLHPRFFHVLVNFPVLFGNLAWIGLSTLLSKVRAREWRSKNKLITALSYSGICGISVLSAMPHQEARFLTPLILPLVISLSGRISKLGCKFWPLWLLINLTGAIIFGAFHQSGVVPAINLVQHQSLGFQDCHVVEPTNTHAICTVYPSQSGVLHMDDGMSYTTHVVFYKTYMPPHHLFGYNRLAAKGCNVDLKISDWRQKSRVEVVADLIAERQRVPLAPDVDLRKKLLEEKGGKAVIFRRIGPKQFERTILIAPATVDFSREYFYESRDSIARHANLDHLDIILQNPLKYLSLNIFYL
ncbi:alpha 1,2 mannosyltransferase [Lobosporangium transversale]|nr:alpha 1,2 mannosyltransferase [Lobosporangium transversale]